MPVRRGRSSFQRRSSSRRRLVWAQSSTFDTVANNANINHDLLANLKVAGSSVLGVTVIRTHMRISLQWPDLTLAFQGLAFGLCVQSMTQVAAGNVDLFADEDWALRDQFLPGTGVNNLVNVIADPVEGFTVDLRAKRKVQELNQTWCLAFSLQNAAGSDPMPVSVFARTLVALP